MNYGVRVGEKKAESMQDAEKEGADTTGEKS
jgi:hypothetical protein